MREPQYEACKQLIAYMLDQAIRDYLDEVPKELYAIAKRRLSKHNAARIKAHEDAIEWIEGERQGEILSFEDVCAFLGLDPDAIREELRGNQLEVRMRVRGREKPSAMAA